MEQKENINLKNNTSIDTKQKTDAIVFGRRKSMIPSAKNNSFTFFLFGCWNIDGCIPNNSHLKKIVDNIRKKDNHKHYSFGIIAGDNIYPNKYNKKLNIN